MNHYVSESAQLDKEIKQNFDFVDLDALGICKKRSSLDKSVDNYGNRLLLLCKDLNLLIANGRLFKDKNIGALTCKESTVVDYCIMSPELFTNILDFEILPYDPMLIGDVHNAIYIEMSSKDTCMPVVENINVDIDDSSVVTKCKWENDKYHEFNDCIDEAVIHSIVVKLEEIDTDLIDNIVVNSIVDECNSLILQAASKCDLLLEKKVIRKVDNSLKKRKVKKPWFNRECAEKRKLYHRAKNYNWRVKTAESKTNLTVCSKEYKKVLCNQYRLYNKNFIKKLKNLRQNDCKSYWNLLNRACSSQTKQNIVNKVSLDCFYNHFKKLNSAQDENDDTFENIDVDNITSLNTEVNRAISENEVRQAIKGLKNNKACGNDLIINEFLKHSADKMLPVFIALFNIVFESGCIPDSWSEGIIVPIYKCKGDPANPDNYRGITVLSCFGKLFTCVLNNRLNCYLDNFNVLCEEQAGFRKHYGTTDHIFNMNCLIDLYLRCNKPLFCAFVDYRKAFDSVDRCALWHKLLQQCIDGKMFKVIHSMYKNAKSCVRLGCNTSSFFFSNVGVRQGENLSPVLFSLFLNDLVEFLSHSYEGLSNVYNAAHIFLDNDEIAVYFRLYLLLYADDTVILAESESELQAALNAMYLYCKCWKLEVNVAKTKIVIFRKRTFELNNNLAFTYDGQNIDIVDDFTYLGIIFASNGSFCKNKERLVCQARKAMFSIMKKSRKLNLPIDIQLEMFDVMVLPILMYGCEIWGSTNNSILESFCLQFYKYILSLKKCTPNCIMYGELGRFPIDIFIKSRMVAFWKRIICNKQDKIAATLYKLLYNMHIKNFFHSKWIVCIEKTLNNCGLSEYWLSQSVPKNVVISNLVKQCLCDQFKQTWVTTVYDSAKCLNYRIFKTIHNFERYIVDLPYDLRKAYCNFRCMNHKLPIEQGRFWGVERDDRICDLCNLCEIGDEFHYLFKCTFFSNERKRLLPCNVYKKPNAIKYCELFCSDDYNLIVKLAKFCKIVLSVIN
ncbi:uncharacterized protein [Mytilus edulis]|uniref:uncharacterized protein n=1 Tax=Mytilus edulis TaxID=6550 RepID=UPI0039F05C25